MRQIKPKLYTDLYVIMLDGYILTPDAFKEFWKNYGNNNLHGWRAPKKIYYTEGQIKAALSHIPQELIGKVEICIFRKDEVLMSKEKVIEYFKQKEERRIAELNRNKLIWAQAARDQKIAEYQKLKAEVERYEKMGLTTDKK